MTDNGYRSAKQLAQALAVGVNTVRRWAETPSFPKPEIRYVGFQPTRFWRINEVRAWMLLARRTVVTARGWRR